MIWLADTQIKIGSSDAPTSNAGPALATSGSRLYLAYAGTNGYIYWAWTDNKSGNFTDWEGDEKVTWDRSAELETLVGPALAFFDGFPVMLSITKTYDAVQCSYFDGNQWNGYALSSLIQPAQGLQFVRLAAFVAGGQLHLFVTDSAQGSIHLVCAGAINELTSWQSVSISQGEQTVSLGLIDGLLYRTGYKLPSEIPFYASYALDPTTGHYLTQEQQTGLVEVADGSPGLTFISILPWIGVVYLIYLSAGDTTLYSATINSYVNGNMLLNPSSIVKTSTVTIKTNFPTSLVIPFQSGFCMAHKGNDNSKLYLSYGH
jgi:hypothetical protein